MGLDTLKIKAPMSCVRRWNYERADKVIRFSRETDRHETYYRQNFRSGSRRPDGAVSDDVGAFIMWRPAESEFVLEVSAKPLGERYLDGIHSGTVDQLFAQLERVNEIEFEPSLLHYARVLRADPCLNVVCGKQTETLAAVRAKLSWFRKRKDDRFESSFLLSNKQEEIKVYDKEEELRGDPLALLLREKLAGCVRVEYTAKKLAKLSLRFEPPRIAERIDKAAGEIVTERSNVLYLREAIQRPRQNVALMSAWEEMRVRPVGAIDGVNLLHEAKEKGIPGAQVLKYAGALYLWHYFNGERKLLKEEFLKLFSRPTAYRLAKQIEDFVALCDPTLRGADAVFERFEQQLYNEAAKHAA